MTGLHPQRPPTDDRTFSQDAASRDRGASEVVSFIITFSIITTMIGLLYTGGSVSMMEIQTGNQIQNAESVFMAMDDSFGELQEGQAPKRAGSLDLDVGASIAVLDESEVAVTVNGPGFSQTLQTRSLEYRLEDRAIAYETGAIFRTNDGASAMISRPSGIFCSPTSNGSVVSIVTLVAPNGSSVASGTATITGIQRSTTLLFPADRAGGTAVENVTIDVTSPREPAWQQYFEETAGWTDDDGDGIYACESADEVFVRQTVIEVQMAN